MQSPLTLSPVRLCHNQACGGRGSRVPKLWNVGLLGRGNRHWMEIECFHRLGAPESKRLRDVAPNLFHPTASPLFRKDVFFILRHSPGGERVRVGAVHQGTMG